MRQQAMFDFEALRALLPKKRSDRRALLRICGFILVISLCAAGLYYNNRRQQMIRARDWMSAIATVEDARIQPAVRRDSQGGGAMLYDVAVLAKYFGGGVEREHWTTIDQHPQLIADAQLQVLRLNKQQCIVRWDPDAPERVVAEIR